MLRLIRQQHGRIRPVALQPLVVPGIDEEQSVESMQSSGSSAGSNSSGTYGTLGRPGPAPPPAPGLADMMDEMTKTLARRRAIAERKDTKEVSAKAANNCFLTSVDEVQIQFFFSPFTYVHIQTNTNK